MIDYPRNSQQTIPESSVKIVGLGGAGSNMLDRVALDGIEGAELLSLNTDVRTLNGTVAGEKIQLGRNLTKGLGIVKLFLFVWVWEEDLVQERPLF